MELTIHIKSGPKSGQTTTQTVPDDFNPEEFFKEPRRVPATREVVAGETEMKLDSLLVTRQPDGVLIGEDWQEG